MDLENPDVELLGLSFSALEVLANWHEVQSVRCRSRAHRLRLQAEGENQVDRRMKFLEQLPDTVMKFLRQGRALEVAQAMTAEHTGLPLVTVQKRWDAFINTQDDREKQARNRLIMDLAPILKNAQIAERVGMHPNSVSRIISQEKRRRISFDRDEHPGLAVLQETRSREIVGHNLTKSRIG